VDWGYLSASTPVQTGPTEDRGVIVVMKSVKADGAKDARKLEYRDDTWCEA
jgi:hypothetical protein